MDTAKKNGKGRIRVGRRKGDRKKTNNREWKKKTERYNIEKKNENRKSRSRQWCKERKGDRKE